MPSRAMKMANSGGPRTNSCGTLAIQSTKRRPTITRRHTACTTGKIWPTSQSRTHPVSAHKSVARAGGDYRRVHRKPRRCRYWAFALTFTLKTGVQTTFFDNTAPRCQTTLDSVDAWPSCKLKSRKFRLNTEVSSSCGKLRSHIGNSVLIKRD